MTTPTVTFNSEEIPLPAGVNYFDIRSVVQGVELIFSLWWNDRANRWFIDVADQTGSPIILGVKLVPGISLFDRANDPRLPSPGLFMLIGEIPTLDTLGISSSLLFCYGSSP